MSFNVGRKRLNGPDFLKYFQLKVPSSDLPYSMVESLLEEWSQGDDYRSRIVADLKNIGEVDDGSRNIRILFRKILEHYLKGIDEELAARLVLGFSDSAILIERWDMSLFFDSPYHTCVSLVLHLLNERVSEQECQRLVFEIVQDNNYMTFLTDILISLCQSSDGRGFERLAERVNIPDLLGIAHLHFKGKYLRDRVNVFEDNDGKEVVAFVIWQWVHNWDKRRGLVDRELLDAVNVYLIEAIGDNPWYLHRILEGSGSRTDKRVVSFNINDMRQVYDVDAWYELTKKLLESPDLEEKLRKDFQLFVDSVEGKAKRGW